jgi:hypothetical protein
MARAAVLRAEAGRNLPDRPSPTWCVSFPARAPTPGAMWSACDVRTRRTGVKRFHHPVVGPLTVTLLRRDSALRRPGPAGDRGYRRIALPQGAPRGGNVVVTKRRVSYFAGSDLDLVLRSQGLGELVLTHLHPGSR